MKKLLLLLIITMPLIAFSQGKKSIDGFLDIPFGSDSITVKNAIAAKGGKQIDSLSRKDSPVFAGFTVSGREVGCVIKFVDNKAYEADFIFVVSPEDEVLDFYDNLRNDINAVYGKGILTNNFRDSENNRTRIRMLKSGNQFCTTLWRSKNKNAASLEFQSTVHSLNVMLVYQDAALFSLVQSRRRSDL